jgi:hypothetical protein
LFPVGGKFDRGGFAVALFLPFPAAIKKNYVCWETLRSAVLLLTESAIR